MTIRFAGADDLPGVNLLRRELHELHANGKPERFQPGFSRALERHLYEIWEHPDKQLIVAELDGEICGFAIFQEIRKGASPYMLPQHTLDIDEFGVSSAHRRQGVGTALIGFIRKYATGLGIERIQLNMWEFNQAALAFYEASGFTTYRRFMELKP
ncbi:MAG: GNAT family N-acetyltransferase [Oscillospiraceae bacterium]|nr:GNAT family N-acetyltransferase [Oscillospiraceae bacterium]